MQDLIVIQKADALDIFTKRELITPLLEKIKHVASSEVFDATTDKGRKDIASMAYRVAQSKTYIESHGKELAAELKELPKLVDSNRKYAKDYLDALRDQVRAPLDAWEKEQEAIKLKEKIEVDHELAIMENIEWKIKKKAEQDRLAKERAEYEAKVMADAEVRAKAAAEAAARKEIIDAEARALSAEREAQRAKEQAQLDIKKAEAQAQIKLDQERLAEQRRIGDEKMRKSNADNILRVHESIIGDLRNIGLNYDQANFILDAVRDNKISALKIVY